MNILEAEISDTIQRMQTPGLKAGDKVKVFQKPITREEFEGIATLREMYNPDEGDGLSMWYVEFDDESGSRYMRTIYTGPTACRECLETIEPNGLGGFRPIHLEDGICFNCSDITVDHRGSLQRHLDDLAG